MATPVITCLPMSTPVLALAFPTVSISAETISENKRLSAAPPPPTTLAEVAMAVEANPKISAARMKQLTAAVRAAARFLHQALEHVPAAPKDLLPRLAQLTPQGAERSAKTLANTRSLVKEALILTRAGLRVRCDGTPLSPAWKTLYQALPTKRLTNALSRFMHCANQAGLGPDQVDQAFLNRFVADLEVSGEVLRVQRRHRETAVFWNQCSKNIAGWPPTLLHEPLVERPRRNLDWSAFPETFRGEVGTYCAWLSGSDVFAEDGPPRPCKPSTIRQRREIIRIAASNLVASGSPIANVTTLDVLIEPENVKTILRRLHARRDRQPTAFTRSVATELIYIASHYRKNEKVAEKLKGARRKLGSLLGGMTKKNRQLLQQLEDDRLLDKLLHVPAALARDARQSTLAMNRRTQMMEIAVAIELLFCAPIRLGNLSMLELGRHLPWTFKHDDIHLSLAADEVKNGRPMLLPLSPSARQLLDEYVRAFRPLLAQPGYSFLFVGPDGKRKTAGSIRDGIAKAIMRRVGIQMSPHQFRHLAGELILRSNPGAYALVQQVLGHINFKTTLSFYTADQSRAAGRVLDEIISARRKRRKQ